MVCFSLSIDLIDAQSYPDRLQYTITSDKKMPNAEFMQEIAKAAEDLHALHKQIDDSQAMR